MTEQRKQKQRIGLLGHPPHMNINPQQPAWGPLGGGADATVPVHSWLLKYVCLQYVCRSVMTVHFTRRSHTKCFDNMHLCEVEVICVSYSWSVLWVEHQEVPWDLKSQSCGFRQWKHCLQLHNCEYHTHSLPKVRRCSRGSIPPKWPCFEDFVLSVAPANSGHACFWRFLLNSTAHDLIFWFSLTAV